MSCARTQHLLTEYYDDSTSPLRRAEFKRHLENCDDCRNELSLLKTTRDSLQHWDDQPVPHWDRGLPLFRKENRTDNHNGLTGLLWQWLPAGLSLAMLVLLVSNLSVTRSADGITLAFGTVRPDTGSSMQQFEQFAAQQQQRQTEALQAFLASMEERQNSNNQLLLETVLEQTSQMTGENFERIYTYFEQQRQNDLMSLQSDYQQLVDSDYQTIQNVQQLANYVRYQGDIR